VILAIASLAYNAANRVRQEELTVRPAEGVRTFVVKDKQLAVPNFAYLNGELLYAATTEGIKHPQVTAYLDSILQFAIATGDEGSPYLAKLGAAIGNYQTTEAEILQEFAPATAEISREDGLRLVRQACDKLEQQVLSLSTQHPLVLLETSSRSA
jgi:carboxylate-amine ligase